MIQCIFTLDYEIHGNGDGALADMVYEPARRLRELFLQQGVRFVNFVEVAELERIEELGTDPAIDAVRCQVRDLFREGFETALHLHPQWYNARREQGRWLLDFGEYNLCTLAEERMARIVGRSLDYLRYLVDAGSFTPISFRAGNWLFQPTQPAARVLSSSGLRVDSSVFKGGMQRRSGLDYRRSLKNGHYWRFESDVNEPDPRGQLIEVPIYAAIVPLWRIVTKKRAGLRGNVAPNGWSATDRLRRIGDFLRVRYPLKLDFCRMTLHELLWVMERILREDRQDRDTLRPVVAIGHTKDLVDLATVEEFLAYLIVNRIGITTFANLYPLLSRTDGFDASFAFEVSDAGGVRH